MRYFKLYINLAILFLLTFIVFSCSGKKDTEEPQNENLIYNVIVQEYFSSGYLLDNEDSLKWHHKNVFDRNTETCWIEGNANDGRGEFIGIELSDSITIDEIRVIPGFFKTDLFYQYNRVFSGSLIFDDTELSHHFPNTTEEQSLLLDNPLTFTKFTFELISTSHESEANHTAISEISFYMNGKEIILEEGVDINKNHLTLLTKETFVNKIAAPAPSVQVFEFYYSHGGRINKKINGDLTTFYKFNEKGELQEEVSSYPSGSLFESLKYTYYPAGSPDNNEVYKRIDYEMPMALWDQHYQEFDHHGNLIISTTWINWAEKKVYRYEYEYNHQGQILLRKSFDPQNNLKITTQYEYDTAGRLLSMHKSSPENTDLEFIVYEYDADGRLVKEKFLSSENNVESYYLYQYNSLGTLISKEQFLVGNIVESSQLWSYQYKIIEQE